MSPDKADDSNKHGTTDAYERIFARFEQVIESSKAGVRKPDPRIYEIVEARSRRQGAAHDRCPHRHQRTSRA